MEFFDLKYFCAVCDNGSFSRAALVMHVSQPALSQRIKKLEEEFGTPLFQRSSRPLRLTEAGEEVSAYARKILSLEQDLKGSLEAMVHPKETVIRVGISPFYSKYYLPAILKQVGCQYPNIDLHVEERISSEQENMLRNDELDFCCLPQDPEVEGLCYEPICIEEILLAVPRQSPLNKQAIPSSSIPFLDLQYIKGQKLVALKQVQKINRLLNPIMETLGSTPEVAYETLDWDTENIMIANGMGVGFVPDILCRRLPDDIRPCYYRILDKGILRRYSIAYKAGKTFTPLQRHLIELFKDLVQQEREDLLSKHKVGG